MKWIWEPEETEQMLALRPNEAKAVAKLLLKQRNDIQKKYDHFEDLHLSGEATERQQNLMFEYEDILGVIDNFIELESERK